MKWTRKAVIAAAFMLFAVVGSATGDPRQPASDSAPWVTDGGPPGALAGTSFAPGGQHGSSAEHLPAARENIEVVGKLEMNTPPEFRFDPDTGDPDPSEPAVVEGQIADLAVYKNAAYLASWAEPSCRRGGFFSVDISNPAAPRQLAFVPALPETYHGEGMHARTINTPSFSGDILIVNNEPCPGSTIGGGGFDLYDVSNPANPQPLVVGAGDRSPDDTSEAQDPARAAANEANSSHSSFIWQDGPRAFAVIVDNTELHDVDIFDITNPRNPVFIGDHDLVEIADAQGVDIIDNSANGDEIFHHDMIVKEINGVQTLLASYWDAGYVKVNVEDPANPIIIGDSAFDQEDPFVNDPRTGRGWNRPEGNGHQAEFSHDNRFVLAADEDFSTYRLPRFDITTGPHAGEYPAGEFGFTTPLVRVLPDNNLNGPTFFGGYGCDVDNDIPPAPGPGVTLEEGEEAILVLSRGPQSDTADPSAPYPACTFQEKAENAAAQGWDAVLIGNHHAGAGGGAQPDSHLCGSGNFADIIAICIGHRAMHNLFDDPPGKRPENYTYDQPAEPQHEPQVGDRGAEIQTSAEFDGWGYTHLYRNAGNDLEAVDHFAIEEAIDERYVFGFGDLSVHEFATDPTEYLAYSSYYAGGMRVLRFGDSGLEQTGKFIDQGGNDFWGVEVFTTPQGDRLFAGSDRSFGLYIFRYTGPGAAQKPACSDVTVMVPYKQSARVPFACSDANNNPLRQSRTSNPEGGTVADHPPSGGWTYTHTGNRLGPAGSFGFKANDGAADSNTATASLVAVARNGGRCFNPFVGSARRDVIIGSQFGDRINSGRGRDTVRARAGADCVSGGSASDRLSGDRGRDRLAGNRGADRLFGGGGRDRLIGAQGNDGLTGRGGADRLSGGRGPDRLNGGGGNDRINVGGATNRASGGAGNDRISARNGKRDKINCGRGRDVVRADANDRVAGNCEDVRRGS